MIVESIYNHKGEKRNLQFNHKKFEKFKDKIIYLVYDKILKVESIKETDNENEKSRNIYLMHL